MRPLTELQAGVLAADELTCPFGSPEESAMFELEHAGLLARVWDDYGDWDYVNNARGERALRVHQAWLASGCGR